MKYFIALGLLAVPLALSAAPTPAEAGYRDGGLRCHWVKKTVYRYGKKRVRFVKQCRKTKFHRRHVRRDFHEGRRYR